MPRHFDVRGERAFGRVAHTSTVRPLPFAILTLLTVSLGLLVPAPTPSQASKIIFQQSYDLGANQKAEFSLKFTKGQKYRFVGSSTDSSSRAAYMDYVRPDGSKDSVGSAIKSSGAGTNAFTFGPASQTGTYRFEVSSSSSGSAVGKLSIKVLLVEPEVKLLPGKSVEIGLAESGDVYSFAVDVKKGQEFRLVTLNTQSLSTVYMDVARPDGTSDRLQTLRQSGAGYDAKTFAPSQSGTYVFDTYFSKASDTGKISLTLLELSPIVNTRVGEKFVFDFSRNGDRSRFALNLTKGYRYRVVTTTTDVNSPSVVGDYQRPDGTSESYISWRSSGAGISISELGPMSQTGTYTFSAYKSNPVSTSNVDVTVVRIDKPQLIKPNTPISMEFTYPGQGFSFAIPVNQGDKVQLQTESTSNVGLLAEFTRPDGTRNTYYSLRRPTAGKSVDEATYSQTGFYIFNIWMRNPGDLGRVTLTVLGSTNSSTNFVSDLPEPERDSKSVSPSNNSNSSNSSEKNKDANSSSDTSGSVASPDEKKVQNEIDRANALTEVAKTAGDKLASSAYSEDLYKTTIEAANKALAAAESAINAAERAKKSAGKASDAEKSALDAKADAAREAREAAQSAKEAAQSAKKINTNIDNMAKAVKSLDTNLNNLKSELDCKSNSDIASDVASIVSPIPILGNIAAVVTGIYSLSSQFVCKKS